MVHFQLLWSDEPVMVIKSDGIDAKEIEERNAIDPAVSEKETNGNHR